MSAIVTAREHYGLKRNARGVVQKAYRGELEFEVRSARNGRIVNTVRQPNIVKIFAKEILSHRLVPPHVWDPNADGGGGAWVSHSINIDEYAPKYMCLGASYDSNGLPLDTADTRYYNYDQVSNSYVPVALDVGADYGGGLINAIPIAEPARPLKRIERVYFEPSYQPAGVPLLQSDVRAINNVVVFETVLEKDEYNGFGLTPQDFFTLTEVTLVGAPEVGTVGTCECDPHSVFLQGMDGVSLTCNLSGTATISLDPSVPANFVNLIQEGDQVKLVQVGGGVNAVTLGQVSPYYLVISKQNGGRDIVLDRTPVNSSNVSLTGQVGVFQDTFRIFSHRILVSPVKKSSDYEITIRWRIIMD